MNLCLSCGSSMILVKKLKLGGKRLDRMKCECGCEQTVRTSKNAEYYFDEQEREIREKINLEKRGMRFDQNLDEN